MDELIQAMSIVDLKKFKESYKDNASITVIIDGYIQVKLTEEAKKKVKVDFEASIAKLVVKLPHPEGVYNVYLVWREVEVEDTTQEAVEVVVDGKVEVRYPKVKREGWQVETNKGFNVKPSTTTAGNTTTTKRGIVLSKRSASNPNQLELIGHFRSASKACEHLKIPVAGDSANRVLAREGYFTEPYEGSEFTA